LIAKDQVIMNSPITTDNPNLGLHQGVATQGPVKKYVLKNGMTVLVRPIHTVPKVSVQLWYDVGSRDEQDKERGIAHLIEHMMFKGTKKLSETDINFVTHMLSGNTNAFTGHDFTGYLFNFPTQHWQEAFTLLADCMKNSTFKEDMLSSEMQAVIQEIKLYRDRYTRSLVDEIIGAIFADHPYHHPIIGYKQDLWSVRSDDLKAFYKKHYLPNNAALVVVGDVDADEVVALAEEKFGSIPADPNYKKVEHYFTQDIISKSVTLYRDIKQPEVIYTFVVPGAKEKKDHILELIARILGKGKGSRLYKKLINKEKLVTSVSAATEELFDHGMLFVIVEPKKIEDVDAIEKIIHEEVQDIIANGVTDAELTRATKQTEMDLYDAFEDFEHQAFEIGKHFLASGDPNYLFNFLSQPVEELKKEIVDLLKLYVRPTVTHKGFVLPLPESEKQAWAKLQEESDAGDKKILTEHVRTTEVEPPKYAHTVKVKDPVVFDYPKATTSILENGLKVLFAANKNTPKIDVILDLKAKHYFEPEDMQGLSQFVSKMLMEGTKKYSGEQLADMIEQRGISLSPYPGGIAMSVLKEDLPFGLEMLHELLTSATFNEAEMEKVREQLLARIKNFWDEPHYFGGQLVKEEVYKGHPYHKNSIGTLKSIQSITKKDLKEFYQKNMSPRGARLAIVGDIGEYNIEQEVKKYLGSWQGDEIVEPEYPKLFPMQGQEINYPINRDQVFLKFAGLSVDRKHPDYDKLLLFDQIFSGGALGSMNSRLFLLREQSGLFYTIGGSFISGANEQPGMMTVQTIVSLDRLEEAEKAIKKTIEQAPDTLTEAELKEAKLAVVNSLIDNFTSSYGIANVFLFLDRFNYAADYFDKRTERLKKVSLNEVKDAAKRVLASNKLLTLRVGRVSGDKKEQQA